MHRLFVAIVPSAPVRASLLALMEGVEGADWHDEDRLHLTLRYIGRVESRAADDIADLLGSVRASAVEISLNGIGTFESRGRVDSLWVGAAPLAGLTALHKKIDHVLTRAGLHAEARAYLPHVTIARLGHKQVGAPEFIMRNSGFDGGSFVATEFALFESIIGRSGTTYQRVVSYPLAK